MTKFQTIIFKHTENGSEWECISEPLRFEIVRISDRLNAALHPRVPGYLDSAKLEVEQ